MKLVFVMGPVFSGKSNYIRKNYKGAVRVSISTFNEIADAAADNDELETLGANAQRYCREALVNTIRGANTDTVIVLEHPMLHKSVRDFFVHAVRQATDAEIECVVMLPDNETIAKMLDDQEMLISLYQFEKEMMEMPAETEGFSRITVVNPVYEKKDRRPVV